MSPRTIGDVLPDLRRPYTPAAVKWKIQTNPKGQNGKAMVVGFIDARLVAERLNDVAPDWEEAYGQRDGNSITCRLTVLGSTHEDVGFSRDVTTDMGIKALYSDAFKRAAVKFGIGAFLYAMPIRRVPQSALTQLGKNWYLPDRTVGMLTKRYEEWLGLEATKKRFGEPTDYGDVAPDLDDAPPPPSPLHELRALKDAAQLDDTVFGGILDDAGVPVGETLRERLGQATPDQVGAALAATRELQAVPA